MGSRAEHLIVQAAAAAGIDYREHQSTDAKWFRRLNWITDVLHREHDIRYYSMRLQACLALLPIVSTDSRERVMELSQAYQDTLESLYYPERGTRDELQEKKNSIRSDKTAWESQFGDVNSPETEEKIEKWIAAMELLQEATAKQAATASPFGTRLQSDAAAALTRGA